MIKINLLALRREKKKAILLKHLELGGVILLVALAVIGYLWHQKNGQLSLLNAEIEAAEIEKLRLLSVIREVKKFEKQREFIVQRLEVINQLKKGQTGPVRFLDMLSLNISEKMWFVSVNERGPTYSIKGFALSNQDIADFMKNMEKAGNFGHIELVSSQQSLIEQQKIMDFTIILASK